MIVRRFATVASIAALSVAATSLPAAAEPVPSPSVSSATSVPGDTQETDTAAELASQVDELRSQLATETAGLEKILREIRDSEQKIASLDVTIKEQEKIAAAQRTGLNQLAAEAHMASGDGALGTGLTGVLTGDFWSGTDALTGISSYAAERDVKRDAAVKAAQDARRAKAQREMTLRTLNRKKAEAEKRRQAIADKLAETETAAGRAREAAGKIQVKGVITTADLTGIKQWNEYRAQLAANGVAGVTRATLNDKSKWAANWTPVTGKSGKIQEGVANVKDVRTGKPLLILPKETVDGISVGLSAVGTPYSWGGGSPSGPTYGVNYGGIDGTGILGYDCSGLMVRIWGSQGFDIASRARTSQVQQVTYPSVSTEDLLPGDMVFFGRPAHHVAIYLGGGMMLEAPRTGLNVRVTPLRSITSANRPSLSS